ncbi:MAG TPA: hypothetical protein VH853_06150 [Polyangia bacterium]|jgi:hypothetical protein|nr:hypothetical protein [Polyangia bacterium]
MNRRSIREPLVFVLALALGGLSACRSSTQVPEAGAALLEVTLGPGAPMPDELRAGVYDDAGALWNGTRIPASGPLVPQSATVLGTILIQPGATVGAVRIDLRGLLGGVLVDEATLKIPSGSLSGATFDVTLAATLPPDSDGDGVPDPIDDCPSVPDPSQSGCGTDGGAGDAATGRSDGASDAAEGDASRDAGRDAGRDADRDAGSDAARGNKGTASGCGSAGECASGFCTDGVCCKTACTDPCNSCVTGTCTAVKNGEDDPECIAPLTCNKKGKCVAADGGAN